MNTDLIDFWCNIDNGYFGKVFDYLGPKDTYRASRVCSDWKKIADTKFTATKIKELRLLWLKTVIEKSGPYCRSLTTRQFRQIADSIDLNPALITANLVSSFIIECENKEDILKIISLAQDIPMRVFNEAVTNEEPMDILRALINKLPGQIEQCFLSAMERDGVKALQLLVEEYEFPSEEWLLNEAMKEKKPAILKFLAGRFPALQHRHGYHQWLLNNAIAKSDCMEIDRLFKTHPHLKISCEEVCIKASSASSYTSRISPNVLKRLLDHALRQGDKVSVDNLVRLKSLASYIYDKDVIYKIFARAFILSNDINNTDLLCRDFEIEKLIRGYEKKFTPGTYVLEKIPIKGNSVVKRETGDSNLYLPEKISFGDFLIGYASSPNLLLRKRASEDGDCRIVCADGETVNAHASILRQNQLSLKTIADLHMFAKETVESLLDFLYVQEMEFLDTKEIINLLALAKHLKLDPLLKKCHEALQLEFKSFYIKNFPLYFDCPAIARAELANLFYGEIKRRLIEDKCFYSICSDKELKEILFFLIDHLSLEVKDLFDLFTLADAYLIRYFRKVCKKAAEFLLNSRPCDHFKLLPYLSENLKLEFFFMEVLLSDIKKREGSELIIPLEVYYQKDSKLAYKTLVAAYIAKKDPKLAIPYFRAAAEKFYSPACIELSNCHRDGIGVEINEEKANKYLEMSKKSTF